MIHDSLLCELEEAHAVCGMTPLGLSPGTDLLILKGQTGPIHNAHWSAEVYLSTAMRKPFIGMTAADALFVSPVLEFLLLF